MDEARQPGQGRRHECRHRERRRKDTAGLLYLGVSRRLVRRGQQPPACGVGERSQAGKARAAGAYRDHVDVEPGPSHGGADIGDPGTHEDLTSVGNEQHPPLARRRGGRQ
jgi:hypothetical protein